MAASILAATSPVTERVRAYFAPVVRSAGVAPVPTIWDPAGIRGFQVHAPPAPWIDLGWCGGFTRHSGTKLEPLVAGAPGTVNGQVRTAVDASVSLQFETWGKLQLALTAGVQQMNVLPLLAGAAANGSGGIASGTVPLTATNGVLASTTTATTLTVGSAAAGFSVGQLVVVDLDYTGQTGYVGSGISGGYVKSAALIGSDIDYVRRVSLNVARVVTISGGVLGLACALPAGVPVAGMQVTPVVGFCDREGGSFFQEWSALFMADGAQGDRVVFHYPRLQAMAGAAESSDSIGTNLLRMRLSGQFRALPVTDANDGEQIVCFRSYLPAAMRAV